MGWVLGLLSKRECLTVVHFRFRISWVEKRESKPATGDMMMLTRHVDIYGGSTPYQRIV